MTITSVTITMPETQSEVFKAYATVCFDEALVVSGIRVFEKNGVLNAVMPAKQSKASGNYHDYAYAVKPELRKAIKDAVIEQYQKMIQEA